MYTDVKPLSKYSDCVVISIQMLSTVLCICLIPINNIWVYTC